MQQPVTELTVKRRLNRRLAEKGECLRKCSSRSPWWNEFGYYYIAEINTTRVVQTDIDLERMARTEGALRSDESMAAEPQWIAPTSRVLQNAISY